LLCRTSDFIDVLTKDVNLVLNLVKAYRYSVNAFNYIAYLINGLNLCLQTLSVIIVYYIMLYELLIEVTSLLVNRLDLLIESY